MGQIPLADCIVLGKCDKGVTRQIRKARHGCASCRTSNAVNSLKCSDFYAPQGTGYHRWGDPLLRDHPAEATYLGEWRQGDAEARSSRLLQGCAVNPAALKFAFYQVVLKALA